MTSDNDYAIMVLEEIRDQNHVVLEAVGEMQDQMKTLATKDELQAVANDVKIIKVALTETNKDLCNLDHRVTALEQA